MVTDLRKVILGLVRQGHPSIRSAAARLGISVRSLQRHLQATQLTFSELVDSARHEAALTLLCESERSVTEIARALGYREPSSFGRAFLRWSGTSPLKWRKCMRAQHRSRKAVAPSGRKSAREAGAARSSHDGGAQRWHERQSPPGRGAK